MEGRDYQQMNLDRSKAYFSEDTMALDFPEMETSKLSRQSEFRKYVNKKRMLRNLLLERKPRNPPLERKPRNPLLKLNRIRDFISLWLSYPMRTVHDGKLKAWIHEVSNAHGFIAEKHRLMRENPLRYLEVLVPMEMIMEIEAGGSSVFPDKNVMPKVILNLAAHLAVNQLVQSLLSGDDHVRNIHHVMLSTRDGAEQRKVFGQIKLALKDKDNMPRFNEIFHGVLCVDASTYRGPIEVLVEQQINLQLQLQLPVSQFELQGMVSKKYLVLLLDGDADKTIDTRKVRLPTHLLEAVMVLITTESPKQANDEITIAMDLKIRTEDHLLPWEVFCRNVDNKIVCSSSAIQRIAVQIVEECGSHLFANVLVAKSLKNVEDVKLWELALNKLSCLDPSYDMNMFQGVSRVMVSAFINFIWNDINKTQKHCLTSCLFIPDIKIGKLYYELMYHWISYRLIDDGEAAHNLRELVERSALLQLQGFKGRYIQLPEDAYVILHSLNTLIPLFMKKSSLGLIEPPNHELWHSAVHMELANNNLSELPLSPNSLELKVLMLQGNVDLSRIPTMFFIKMPLLWMLDLSYTSVRELPNSFFELEQLRELYLKGCECFIKLSPDIGKLKRLEKLDLDQTQIIHLPKEMQELTSLQSLILCFYEYLGNKSKQYTCLTIIPSGVISKLKGLKHLSIDVNPDDERWHDNVQDILPEILGLECLLTLSLYIPHLELLKLIPTCIFELDFRFIVGRHMQRIISGTPPKYEARFKRSDYSLKFVNGIDIPYEIKKLVGHSKALFLDRHTTIKNLSEFEMMNLEQLRVCMLAECRQMQTIVDGRHSNSDKDMLSHLVCLSVSYMKNLRSIWEGPKPHRCFLGMLKSLVLFNCPNLTTIFTSDFLGNLSLLKEFIVKDCPKISTLISDGSSKHTSQIFLPKLKNMLLLHLPELISISNGFHMGPSLENIGIYDCPKLQSLSKMELSSQNLKVIKGESKWWEALKWSEVEWEKAYGPSKLDHIFSPINKLVDIMSQLEVDEDIDDSPVKTGGIVHEPVQPFSKKYQKQNADKRMTWSVSKRLSPGIGEETLDYRYSWWRYAQKEILGSKYPRSCCSALTEMFKDSWPQNQVQRLDEDPTISHITSRGMRTCTLASNEDLFDTHNGKQTSNAVLEPFSSVDDSVLTQDTYMESTFPDWSVFR